MSIILKGIDMPKGTDGLSITFHSQDGSMETHILDATQAIQIPKGHGRLGDLDEIGRRARASYRMGDFGINEQSLDNLRVVEDIIDNAPYYLEAEEENEMPI